MVDDSTSSTIVGPNSTAPSSLTGVSGYAVQQVEAGEKQQCPHSGTCGRLMARGARVITSPSVAVLWYLLALMSSRLVILPPCRPAALPPHLDTTACAAPAGVHKRTSQLMSAACTRNKKQSPALHKPWSEPSDLECASVASKISHVASPTSPFPHEPDGRMSREAWQLARCCGSIHGPPGSANRAPFLDWPGLCTWR